MMMMMMMMSVEVHPKVTPWKAPKWLVFLRASNAKDLSENGRFDKISLNLPPKNNVLSKLHPKPGKYHSTKRKISNFSSPFFTNKPFRRRRCRIVVSSPETFKPARQLPPKRARGTSLATHKSPTYLLRFRKLPLMKLSVYVYIYIYTYSYYIYIW